MAKTTTSLNADIFSVAGKKSGSITLPASVFAAPWNESLVHQVVTSMMDNARTAVAHTKDRGEVRGGGKKPWRQKGTGRARHGSRRSPIWVGGGITHGPRNEKNYARKINRAQSAAALRTILSEKLRSGKILFVNEFEFSEPKSAQAKTILSGLSGVQGFEAMVGKTRNAALIALPSESLAVAKSFRNFGNVSVATVRNLNAVQALKAAHVIFVNPNASIPALAERIGNNKLGLEDDAAPKKNTTSRKRTVAKK